MPMSETRTTASLGSSRNAGTFAVRILSACMMEAGSSQVVMKLPRCLSQVIGLVDLRYQGPECRGKREISQFRVGPLGRVLEWICSAS